MNSALLVQKVVTFLLTYCFSLVSSLQRKLLVLQFLNGVISTPPTTDYLYGLLKFTRLHRMSVSIVVPSAMFHSYKNVRAMCSLELDDVQLRNVKANCHPITGPQRPYAPLAAQLRLSCCCRALQLLSVTTCVVTVKETCCDGLLSANGCA